MHETHILHRNTTEGQKVQPQLEEVEFIHHSSSFLGSKVQVVHTHSSLTFAASDMQSRSLVHLWVEGC